MIDKNKGHFNYTYKLKDDIKALVKSDVLYQPKDEDVIKGWWVETDIADSNRFKALQMLVGDTGDDILGCGEKKLKIYKSGPKIGQKYHAREGIGPKKAEQILDTYSVGTDLYTFLFDQYRAFYKDNYSVAIFEFQKNYRLLHMLENDQDFMREIGTLPEFPTITEVIKEVTDKPEIEF